MLSKIHLKGIHISYNNILPTKQLSQHNEYILKKVRKWIAVLFSGMQCGVVLKKFTSVSEECTASIFRTE
jgi:hypothetical protein